MGQSSYWGYYRAMPDDAAANGSALSASEPVSAGRAFDARSNLLHLADEFCQHRINWVAAGTGAAGSSTIYVDHVDGAIYEQEFPLTWLSPEHPANLDIFVRTSASGTSAAMTTRVRVVPAYTAIQDLSGPALIDVSGTTTTTTGSLEELTIWDTTDTTVMELLRSANDSSLEIEEDNEWHKPEVCMLRLQVHLLPTAGTGTLTFLLTGVMVREFP